LGRVQQQNTFEPSIVEPSRRVLGGRRRDDDDDDEGSIRADRVESLAELGISMDNLDIAIDSPRVQRESFANVVKEGLGLGAGYVEAPRSTVGIPVSNDAVKDILREGAALRPGTSTEIK
jgi:coenzyme F420-reducing hydrogenase alpha subunit